MTNFGAVLADKISSNVILFWEIIFFQMLLVLAEKNN